MTTTNNPVMILLADDDEDDRLLTGDALRVSVAASGFQTVSDGEALMDYLYRRGKNASSPRPDLVFLDLNMPKKDGREALREMKADPALRSIPVIVLTTSQTDDDIEGTYRIGANSYIVKPVTYEGLVQAMKVATEYWFKTVRLPIGVKE